MRRFALALVLACLAAGPASADEPLSPEDAARAVEAALKAGDEEALAARGAARVPDRWLVVDALAPETAAAFAGYVTGEDAEALARYAKTTSPTRAARRAQFEKIDAAIEAGRFEDALFGDSPDPVDDVPGVRIWFGRGFAHRALGQQRDAAEAFARAGEGAESLGWSRLAAQAFDRAGTCAHELRQWPAAAALWTKAAAAAERRGDHRHAAQLFGKLGFAIEMQGNAAAAGDAYRRAIAAAKAAADPALEMRAWANLGIALESQSRFDDALEAHERSRELAGLAGDEVLVARATGNIANVHRQKGEFDAALAAYGQALEVFRRLDVADAVASTLSNIALIQQSLGEHAQALEAQLEALATFEKLGAQDGMASTLIALGDLYLKLDRHAEALDALRRARELATALRNPRYMLAAWGNEANVRQRMGQLDEAVAAHKAALEIAEAVRHAPSIAAILGNLGAAQVTQGDLEGALASLERAIGMFRQLGDETRALQLLDTVGVVYIERGEPDKALAAFEQALAMKEELGSAPDIARTLEHIGDAHRAKGDTAKAREAFRRALDVAGDTAPRSRASVLASYAALELETGAHDEAVRLARAGAELAVRSVFALADVEGARAREVRVAPVFDTGLQASIAGDDVGAFLWFAEAGRASGLAAALDPRRVADAVLPDGVREAEAAARAAESEAMAAFQAARAEGSRKAARQARRALDAAREQLAAAVAASRRAANLASDLVSPPEPEGLPAIQQALVAGEALLLYAVTEGEAACLVVTPAGARLVRLGASAGPVSAVEAALVDEPPYVVPEAVAAAASAWVQPLALGADVKRVLVSPDGGLGHLPLALLFPGRDVAFMPSGSTLVGLRTRRTATGHGVLGIGDPVYGDLAREGATRAGLALDLPPLPATRIEVEAVASVRLLGPKAAVPDVIEALGSRPRWRAVHFACHGIVDDEHPERSALVLSASEDDDGFLDVLDVYRLATNADLVTLSACETGKGKRYRAEGMLGLTRAFMQGGTRCVLGSLWKVDDAATQALMVKFYDLWNPDADGGLTAAAALREAQAYVRAQKDWDAPYFWAGWVLWGLP